MGRRLAGWRSHFLAANDRDSHSLLSRKRFLGRRFAAGLERELLWRLCRFENLEPLLLMTAAGWETPLMGLGTPPAGSPGIPELELHGSLHPAIRPDGFIHLRDYAGDLLSNWEELVREHDSEQEENEEFPDALPQNSPSSNYQLAGETSIDAQYSLWNNKWPQSNGLGSPLTVTYSYSNILDGNFVGITTDQIKAGIEKALQLWSSYAPLNFVEVVDSGPTPNDSSYVAGTTPNIRVGYHAIDGASQVLAHAYYPQGTQGLSGDMHFDVGETWRIGAGGGGIDFVEVALHELGHSLGLQHESGNTAIMNPIYGGRFATLNSAYLLTDDINGIRALYGTGTGSVTPLQVNHAPVLDPISDVTISRSQDTIVIGLSASDSDGNPLSFSASASQQASVDLLAYQLDQQYGFSLNGSDYYNYRGAGEKYVTSSGGEWFFVLADGSLHSWNGSIAGSPTIATLDSSFHTTLSKLYNAQLGAGSPVNVGISWNGANLTLDPASNFTGTFQVIVNASDGVATASRTFNVTVSNQAPTLTAIADQSMRPSDDSIAIALSYADADGDALTVTASVAQADATRAAAYALDQQYQFQAAASDYSNARGAGEKYFQNAAGAWYFILANGQVYSWTGSIAGSTLLGTLDSRFHSDLSLLYNAQPDQGAPANVGLSISGNTLTVNPPNGYTGSFAVTVSATDGAATTQRTFQLSVANHAPTVGAIADLSISPSAGSRTIIVSATDVDGDSVSLSATALQIDSTLQQAYDLDQQRGFQTPANDYYNLRGAGEKYFLDASSNWYFILSNGAVYQWGGSMGGSSLLATLDSSFHSTLSKLCNATAPVGQALNAGLSWNGNSLTITPPNGFAGSFQVTVTASDGTVSTNRSFAVSVANHAPQMAAIANQTMSPQADTLQVALNASDPDGDSLSYTVTAMQVNAVGQTAYTLDQQHNFRAAPNEYLNYRGASEKYFHDASGNWYFILPNANVYAWTTSIQGSTLLGQLDSTYYSNVSKLFDVASPTGTPVNVTLQVANGQLTIDPAANFTGSFLVTVAASDGLLTSQTSFLVTIANQTPTLAAIANQSMSTSQDTLQVAFQANDLDGDPLTMTATAAQIDATAQAAYNLDQQYGFYAASSEYVNLRGAGEKYFQGTGGSWYFMLAGGQVYQWGGSIAGSTLLTTLNSSYYANLSLLHQAQQPVASAVNVNLGISNGVLTIDPASNFTGQFQVTLVASDGLASASRTFTVTVTSAGSLTAPASGSMQAPPTDPVWIVTPLTDLRARAERTLDPCSRMAGCESWKRPAETNAPTSTAVVTTGASHGVEATKRIDLLTQLIESLREEGDGATDLAFHRVRSLGQIERAADALFSAWEEYALSTSP